MAGDFRWSADCLNPQRVAGKPMAGKDWLDWSGESAASWDNSRSGPAGENFKFEICNSPVHFHLLWHETNAI
jgi:hypothetical protein